MNRFRITLAAALIVNMTVATHDGATSVFAQTQPKNFSDTESIKDLLKQSPEASTLWEEIETLTRSGDLSGALTKANTLVKKYPTRGAVYFKRAQVFISMSKPELGMKDIKKSMELGPVTAASYAVRSRLNYDLKNFKEALSDIDTALQLNPQKKNALAWRASVLTAMGRSQEAETSASGAAHDNPESLKLAMKAARQNKKSNPELAIEYLNRAVKIAPKNSEPWSMLAEMRLKSKDYRQAAVAFDKAIKLDPTNAELYYGRARLKKSTLMAQDAIKDCDRAILINKTKASYYRLRSELLAQIGKFEEALSDANKAVGIDPHNLENRSARAEVLMQTGNINECIKECSLGLAQSPDFVPLLINRADAYEKINKKALALKDYKRASELSKISFRNLVRKGTLESELGFNQEAIKTYTIAISRAESTAKSRAYIERAAIYDKLGKTDEAKADRRQAKELSSGFMDDVLPAK